MQLDAGYTTDRQENLQVVNAGRAVPHLDKATTCAERTNDNTLTRKIQAVARIETRTNKITCIARMTVCWAASATNATAESLEPIKAGEHCLKLRTVRRCMNHENKQRTSSRHLKRDFTLHHQHEVLQRKLISDDRYLDPTLHRASPGPGQLAVAVDHCRCEVMWMSMCCSAHTTREGKACLKS